MSWSSSLFVALLTAVAAMFVAGFIAAICVDWYQISSREGASGYFVISIAILGIFAGLVIGAIASKIVGSSASPGFLKALGLSLGVVVTVGLIVTGVARILADIPPEIDGEALLLDVEVRWPIGQPQSPALEPGPAYVSLGSVTRMGHVQRASTRGPLWKHDARQVDGRWVVPGAVEVFTSRGKRAISILIDTTSLAGFLVPLPAFPGKANLEWSGWLPAPRAGNPPWPADRFSYRFRVQKRSEPVRTESVGPFAVRTIASQFYSVQYEGGTALAATANFRIEHHGRPVVMEATAEPGTEPVRLTNAEEVSVIGGPIPALLVKVEDPNSTNSYCFLVKEEADTARATQLVGGWAPSQATPLTTDPARFAAARSVALLRGSLDRRTFAVPGLYLLGFAVLDTRRLTVRHFEGRTGATGIPAVPPLGISPDERSFVRFANAENSGLDETHVLVVTDVGADSTYLLPIDEARMRYPSFDALDPAWLLHHFGWERRDGVDRLVERKGFVPLPYHGKLSAESYRIEPASGPLRSALVEFLVKEFKAERLPADSGEYEQPIKIDGKIVKVAASDEFNFVAVSMDHGAADSVLVAEIAKRFDRELATGKYDALFGKKPRG